MKLYSFFRSSASYRVRIALNLKGIEYEQIPIHLRRGGGEQLAAPYRAINPQALLPTLDDGGRLLSQSLAIIEYLNERVPEPPLLPSDPADRAIVRSMALLIACEIHPIQNLRVLVHLKQKLNHSDDDVNGWARHWIELGFGALEESVNRLPDSGYCFGNWPTLADICLVPQMSNARRFGCDLARFPRLQKIEQNCLKIQAFADAAPEKQPDAE
ncbi:MAG TPA: maleylacetoacetate isomerase [Candidatus Binatia bacterium]|jgi:maleylacetoacetate isomerase